MANKEIIFQNAARDLGTGQFFALKLIDGGTVYTMYLEELTQPPRQPAIASQITATGVPVIAPSGAGDVIGIGTTNTIPLWTDGPNSVIGNSLLSQSGGNVVMASGNLVLAAAGLITFPDNVRQVFNPGAAVAGLNVGAVAVDPTTPINGDLWYDSALDLLRARISGASVTIGATNPGGLDTQVQFNDSSAFGGDAGLTYNKTSNVLTITSGGLTLASGSNLIGSGIANRIGTAGTNDATADTMLTSSGATKRALTLQGSRAAGNADPLFAITDFTAGANVLRMTSDGAITSNYINILSGSTVIAQNSSFAFSTSNQGTSGTVGPIGLFLSSSGSGASRMVTLGNDTSAIGAMLQNTGGRQRVVADIPNTTTAFAAITGLGFNSSAAGKYTGRLVIKCNNTTATEGIKFDFNGGTATVSAFWAVASVSAGGTTVLGTVISTSLAGVMNFTTITGETLIVIEFSLVASGAGTVIPRFAENSTAVGTATVELGSFMWTESTP